MSNVVVAVRGTAVERLRVAEVHSSSPFDQVDLVGRRLRADPLVWVHRSTTVALAAMGAALVALGGTPERLMLLTAAPPVVAWARETWLGRRKRRHLAALVAAGDPAGLTAASVWLAAAGDHTAATAALRAAAAYTPDPVWSAWLDHDADSGKVPPVRDAHAIDRLPEALWTIYAAIGVAVFLVMIVAAATHSLP